MALGALCMAGGLHLYAGRRRGLASALALSAVQCRQADRNVALSAFAPAMSRIGTPVSCSIAQARAGNRHIIRSIEWAGSNWRDLAGEGPFPPLKARRTPIGRTNAHRSQAEASDPVDRFYRPREARISRLPRQRPLCARVSALRPVGSASWRGRPGPSALRACCTPRMQRRRRQISNCVAAIGQCTGGRIMLGSAAKMPQHAVQIGTGHDQGIS